MQFVKATKKQSRLRMAIIGPAGSGKTFTALKVGCALVPGGKVAVIDTERGSASKYADQFEFDVLELDSFAPATYVKALKAANAAGYDVVIVDSLSHAWTGTDGALQMVDKISKRSKSGSSFNAWRDVTPEHNGMVDAILRTTSHVIATMRVKTEYVLETNSRGKTAPRKIGLAPVQRDGLEYEFDVVGDIDPDNGYTITKTRCSPLTGQYIEKPGEDLAQTLREWLTDGSDEPEIMREPAPPSAEELEEAAIRVRLDSPEIKELFDKLNATPAKRLAALRKYKTDEEVMAVLTKRITEAEKSSDEGGK